MRQIACQCDSQCQTCIQEEVELTNVPASLFVFREHRISYREKSPTCNPPCQSCKHKQEQVLADKEHYAGNKCQQDCKHDQPGTVIPVRKQAERHHHHQCSYEISREQQARCKNPRTPLPRSRYLRQYRYNCIGQPHYQEYSKIKQQPVFVHIPLSPLHSDWL